MRAHTNASEGERPSKLRANFRAVAFYAILALAPVLVLTLTANAFFRIWQREDARRLLRSEGFDLLFDPDEVWVERFVGEFESLRGLQVATMSIYTYPKLPRQVAAAETGRAMAAFPECVRLEIYGHDVSVDFLEQLSRSDGLRDLVLSEAAIDARCCNAISKISSLESIYVGRNVAVDDAAALLLLKTPVLKSLNLWGTSITDEFCERGAGLGRSLAYMELAKTKVSAAGLAKCCRRPGIRCVAGSLPKALVLEHGDPRLVYQDGGGCSRLRFVPKTVPSNFKGVISLGSSPGTVRATSPPSGSFAAQ